MPEIEQAAAESTVLFEKYEVGRLLGCGAFAKVYHARNTSTGQSMAVKAEDYVYWASTHVMNLNSHVAYITPRCQLGSNQIRPKHLAPTVDNQSAIFRPSNLNTRPPNRGDLEAMSNQQTRLSRKAMDKTPSHNKIMLGLGGLMYRSVLPTHKPSVTPRDRLNVERLPKATLPRSTERFHKADSSKVDQVPDRPAWRTRRENEYYNQDLKTREPVRPFPAHPLGLRQTLECFNKFAGGLNIWPNFTCRLTIWPSSFPLDSVPRCLCLGTSFIFSERATTVSLLVHHHPNRATAQAADQASIFILHLQRIQTSEPFLLPRESSMAFPESPKTQTNPENTSNPNRKSHYAERRTPSSLRPIENHGQAKFQIVSVATNPKFPKPLRRRAFILQAPLQRRHAQNPCKLRHPPSHHHRHPDAPSPATDLQIQKHNRNSIRHLQESNPSLLAFLAHDDVR
ncbi:hypothetical protein LR48_Vigan01g076100 [Vigna angularis]|uniref:Protein kinase domain-containing protein n=1 Tax=Phaseolus angularis TaxID=3914 RepID=A0A0L9TL51_PHAAN|nr:hypothetical protein LR48_Vigan01g076100 [Vigna angularis]